MHREFYRFGGMNPGPGVAGGADRFGAVPPLPDGGGTAEHTIGLTFSDRLPQPPEDAAHWG